jgi:sirohydrochlorin cobaltochelatase
MIRKSEDLPEMTVYAIPWIRMLSSIRGKTGTPRIKIMIRGFFYSPGLNISSKGEYPMLQTVFKAVVSLLILCITAGMAVAADMAPANGKTAILLASFGSTVPSAVKSITHISEQVKKAYPETEVRISFTSNMVRAVWKKRRLSPQEWLDQGVPAEILNVKNLIQTLGDLQEDGYRNVIVQPTHMFYMEQSHDLAGYVRGIESIQTLKARWQPFDNIVLGRPALGMPGDRYNYHDDVARVVKTLENDAREAKEKGAILLYMGHGNEHWSTGIYGETQKKLREEYPGLEVFIGVVEGLPSLEELLSQLKLTKKNKIVLRPFMITAGDHAKNDMAGPDADSWKSILTAEGFEVQPVLEGLGSKDAFADIFVGHIADAARERGISL